LSLDPDGRALSIERALRLKERQFEDETEEGPPEIQEIFTDMESRLFWREANGRGSPNPGCPF
jgi:hypothetical protein